MNSHLCPKLYETAKKKKRSQNELAPNEAQITYQMSSKHPKR